MSNFVTVEFKRTRHVDLGSALRRHITQHFTALAAHPDDFIQDFQTLNTLRKQSTLSKSDKETAHASVLQDMLSYAKLISCWNRYMLNAVYTNSYQAQLHFLLRKFPDEVVSFPWYPIFDTQGSSAASSALPGMLPSQQPVSLSSLTYERLCILFNVACMYLALGIEEQDKKRAIALYQNSAGVFDYIKSIKVSASDAKEPCSPEFSSHALEAFQQLALGQAQECSFELAVSGHMKDGTVARICQKVSDYHAAAAESATKAQGTEAWPVFMFPSSLVHHLKLKAAYFAGLAQHRKSSDDLAASRYGDEIARLRLAQNFFKDASTLVKRTKTGLSGNIKDLQAAITENLARATKDNELIYLQPITPSSSLTAIVAAPMVKPTVPTEITTPQDRPLFATLVPYSVHLAISIYDDRKDQLVRRLSARAEELDSIAASSLHSLGLPGLLQVSTTQEGVPKDLQRQAEEIKRDGGAARIRTMMSDVQKLSRTAKSSVNEINTNEPSLQQKADQYRQLVDSASSSDATVRTKYAEWSDWIERMSGNQSDIEALLPQARDIAQTPEEASLTRRIRQAMEAIEMLSSDRQSVVDEAKRLAHSDDIRPKVLREASQDTSVESFEPMFERDMRKYDLYSKRLEDTETQQQNVLSEAQNATQEFLKIRQATDQTQDRERVLQNFSVAATKYREIVSNLSEGMKFYGDLGRLIHALKFEVEQARRAEDVRQQQQPRQPQQRQFGQWTPNEDQDIHFG